MDVRPCQAGDLPDLSETLPLTGPYGHDYRLRFQEAGRWLYLVAVDQTPIGVCVVHWHGPVQETVRQELPDAVEISNLHVAASARRSGAGRRLIAEAERQSLVRQRGTIGVAVSDENDAARRLYERLGYAPSGIRFRTEYDYVDESGSPLHAVEEGDFLIKSLPAP